MLVTYFKILIKGLILFHNKLIIISIFLKYKQEKYKFVFVFMILDNLFLD